MSRFLTLLAVLAAGLIVTPGASAASPGIISVSASPIVKVDRAGVPGASAVIHSVYRSSYDGGALTLKVRDAGGRVVLEAWTPSWTQPCEPEPSYRCASRLRVRDLSRVDGRTLRRGRPYFVEAGFESFSGGIPPFNPFELGVRYAAFWTI